jgi:enamine deaminase RidA (YjgF/YER057c/UK114 family)
LCRAAGTTMANTLRAEYFVADVNQFPGIAMAWEARFGAQPHPFVCIQTPAAMPVPGMALISDFWISTAS